MPDGSDLIPSEALAAIAEQICDGLARLDVRPVRRVEARLLPANDAAIYCGFCRAHDGFREWARRHGIQHVRRGRRRFYDAADLNAAIDQEKGDAPLSADREIDWT